MLIPTRMGLSIANMNAVSLANHLRCGLHTSSIVGKPDVMKVFDRNAKRLQRERAAILPNNEVYDYIKEEVGFRLADRLSYIKKDFKIGLELGCGKGFVARNLTQVDLDHWYMCDHSPGMLDIASPPENIKYTKKIIDEEAKLPLDDETFDVVISNLALHWVNDLPSCLREVYRILKKDGVFLASMFGGDSLYELRSSLIMAELEREGGFASHTSPLTRALDIVELLNFAGFRLVTIDSEDITMAYPSLFELMGDLKGMAENNASINRKTHLHKDTLMAAAAIYQELYGHEKGIPATFEIIFMIGWRPDPSVAVSQSAPGSATVSLKDIHRLEELVKESGMEGRLKFMKEQDSNPDDDGKKGA